MSRRDEVLRVATELLAARLAATKYGTLGDQSKQEACDQSVEFAERLVASVDRRHPAEVIERGGPGDR